MSLDFTNRVLGKILVDLGNDERPNVGMEGVSEIGKCPGRRHDDESGYLPLADYPLHFGSDKPGETVLFDVVPVDGLDRAALARMLRLADASGPFASLFVR